MAMKHSQLRELFIATCDLSPPEQVEYLETHCTNQPELRSELLKLLEQDQTSGLFSDGSTIAGLEFQLDTILETPLPLEDLQGRYQLGNEIARGGMGVIVEALDKELGRELAIKILLDEHKSNPQIVQRFLDEAQIGGQLQHPGIAPVYEVGQLPDQRPFISMKLVKGQTLATLLRHRQSPKTDLGKFLGIFEQVCQTIAFAHSRSVIHRDLKPSNIMVGAFGEVQVMDWGLAKVISNTASEEDNPNIIDVAELPPQVNRLETANADADPQTQAGSVMGTPAYMPPEQAQGRVEKLDQRTDVFALGAILCKILTGKEVYLSESSNQLLGMASNGELADCFQRLKESKADPELVRIATHCLEFNQLDRPGDGGELAKQISQHIETIDERLRNSEIDRAKQSVQAKEERRRRRTQVALATTLLVATILASIGWATYQKQVADGMAATRTRINRSLSNARLHRGLAEAANDQTDPTCEERVRELNLALADAQDAATLAESGNADPSLRLSATSLLREVEKRLDNTRQTAQQMAADMQLKQELETIRLTNGRRDNSPSFTTNQKIKSSYGNSVIMYDTRLTAREYERVFAKAGYNVVAENFDQLAELLQQSTIRRTLTSALDNWARAIAQNEIDWHLGPGNATSSELLQLANQVDSNSWRREIRTAILNEQTERLYEIAEGESASEQPLEMICWLGATLRNVEAHEASVRLLRKAHTEHPGDFWLNYELAASLAAMGEKAEGLGYMRTAVGLRPNNPATHTKLCRMLADMNRMDDAMEAYKRVLQISPNFTNAHFQMARALSIANRQDEAIGLYEKAIEIDGEFGLALDGIGMCLSQQGKWDEAIEMYERGNKLEPKRPDHLFHIAICLENKGLIQEAIRKYEEALEVNPKYAKALVNLGNIYQARRQLNKATRLHEAALAITPDDAIACNTMGWTYALQGRTQDAEKALRKSIKLDPQNADSRVNMGNVFGILRQPESAIKEYQTAIEIDPEHVKALVQLGYILSTLGKANEAIDMYDRALEIAPDDRVALDNKGIIFLGQGKFEEAEKTLLLAAEVAPQNANVRFNLGFALNGLGKADEALVEFRKAVELRPNHIPYLVNLGFTYNKQGNFPNAIATLEKAIDVAPNDIIALKNLARALEGDEQLPEAVAIHHRVIELKPADAEQHGRLGTVFLKLEKLENAMEVFETAINLTPNKFDYHDSIARLLVTSKSEAGDYFAKQEGRRLAEEISESQPESKKFKLTLGIAQFRNENWKAALESLNDLNPTNLEDEDFQIEALLFSAMANLHLKDTDQAGEQLAKALTWKVDQANPLSPSQTMLFAEATNLIEPKN
jgi:serine/threonine-protein kinase